MHHGMVRSSNFWVWYWVHLVLVCRNYTPYVLYKINMLWCCPVFLTLSAELIAISCNRRQWWNAISPGFTCLWALPSLCTLSRPWWSESRTHDSGRTLWSTAWIRGTLWRPPLTVPLFKACSNHSPYSNPRKFQIIKIADWELEVYSRFMPDSSRACE